MVLTARLAPIGRVRPGLSAPLWPAPARRRRWHGSSRSCRHPPSAAAGCGAVAPRRRPAASPAADELPYNRAIFLFDKAGVVLVADPPAGEGELLTRTVRQQFFVDELTAVVRVDAQYRKGKQPTRPLQRVHDAVLGSVQKRQALRPGRGDVGQREGVQECAFQAAATAGDGPLSTCVHCECRIK